MIDLHCMSSLITLVSVKVSQHYVDAGAKVLSDKCHTIRASTFCILLRNRLDHKDTHTTQHSTSKGSQIPTKVTDPDSNGASNSLIWNPTHEKELECNNIDTFSKLL